MPGALLVPVAQLRRAARATGCDFFEADSLRHHRTRLPAQAWWLPPKVETGPQGAARLEGVPTPEAETHKARDVARRIRAGLGVYVFVALERREGRSVWVTYRATFYEASAQPAMAMRAGRPRKACVVAPVAETHSPEDSAAAAQAEVAELLRARHSRP